MRTIMLLPPPPRRKRVPLLGPVSLLDCLVFCLFLAPQLLLQAGIVATFACILRALPFLLLRLPLSIVLQKLLEFRIRARAGYYSVNGTTVASSSCGPSSKMAVPGGSASVFEDIVVRCVRWGFAHMPMRVIRVFFSRAVNVPFLRFRQLRHGHFARRGDGGGGGGAVSPPRWREYVDANFRGVWIVKDSTKPADIVLFFAHGGGYAFGTSYFYLEFLLSWVALLTTTTTTTTAAAAVAAAGAHSSQARFSNPAVFSLDYTLAPEATYPTQLREAVHAYAHVLSTAARNEPERIIVAGDSAGGGLVLSLLLYLARARDDQDRPEDAIILGPASKTHRSSSHAPAMAVLRQRLSSESLVAPPLPRFAVLISPWLTLWSHRYRQSPSDFLDVPVLSDCAVQFLGRETAARVAPIQRTPWYVSAPGSEPFATRSSKSSSRLPSSSAVAISPLMSPGDCHDDDWWRRAAPSCGFLVTYGEEEVFVEEICAWAAGLRKAGIEVEVDATRGLGVHAWPLAAVFVGDSDARRFGSLRAIVEAIRRRLTS